MTNAATIEVYGPIEEVERAASNLAGVVGTGSNHAGSLVVDLGDVALFVGRDDDLAFIVVDGPETDSRAAEVFDQMAVVLPYRMDLTDAASSGIVRRRDALPAA